MKCALHVHTSLSDAAFEPDEVIKIYADLDFGCVAITDHEFLLGDDYVSRVLSLENHGMLVLAGVEMDYVPWHYQHLLRIMGEKETLHVLAHPSAYYLEVGEVIDRLGSEPFCVDAVETTYRGRYIPEYDTSLIAAPKIASDDAHEPGDCGRAWIEMEDTGNPDQVIRAVKAGDFRMVFFRRW